MPVPTFTWTTDVSSEGSRGHEDEERRGDKDCTFLFSSYLFFFTSIIFTWSWRRFRVQVQVHVPVQELQLCLRSKAEAGGARVKSFLPDEAVTGFSVEMNSQ